MIDLSFRFLPVNPYKVRLVCFYESENNWLFINLFQILYFFRDRSREEVWVLILTCQVRIRYLAFLLFLNFYPSYLTYFVWDSVILHDTATMNDSRWSDVVCAWRRSHYYQYWLCIFVCFCCWPCCILNNTFPRSELNHSSKTIFMYLLQTLY